MPEPAISVVVATRNRSALLPRLLSALAGQTLPPREVVVVDDGSTDDTWEVLERLRASYPVLLPLRQRHAGPATARNRGWRATTAELVAFTDDDCTPLPGWLHALREGLLAADIVQGRTTPDPATADRLGPFGRTLEVTAELGYYQTCNMGYRRAALERVAGFDERFTRPSGEDTDLAWRLKERGATSMFVDAAEVHHDVRPSSLVTHLRDTWRWGDCALAIREHPQLRRLIHHRWFFRQSHPPALAGAVGVALLVAPRSTPAARAAGVALLAPYADLRLRRWPLRGGPRRRVAAIPAALLADVVEVGVMVVASVRYRTFVL